MKIQRPAGTRKAKEPTRNFLGGIAGDGSRYLVKGSGDAILSALSVALSLGLLVLNVALGLTLLSRGLPGIETGQVTDLLFDLSQGVLGGAGSLAVNETGVSKGSSGNVEECRGV